MPIGYVLIEIGSQRTKNKVFFVVKTVLTQTVCALSYYFIGMALSKTKSGLFPTQVDNFFGMNYTDATFNEWVELFSYC